jgi:Domain of unknown function (DUF1851)
MLFDNHYRPDGQQRCSSEDVSQLAHLEPRAPGLVGFLSGHAGASFENGLYRIHSLGHMNKWTSIVAEAFPDFRQRVFCFAYDWLGRHFALDFGRQERMQNLVIMLEPGTGQALEIPANFIDFHNRELVEYRKEALASDFYRSWLSSGGAAPSPAECVGYSTPLFLGGADLVENLELVDMEVYWSIAGQLLAKTRGLPAGSRIGEIRIKD